MNEFKYIVGVTDEIQEGLNFWLTIVLLIRKRV